MTKFTQHSIAAVIALAIVAATWIPVISVPSAHAGVLLTMPVLA